VWEIQCAVKKNKKERAMQGMIMGIRRETMEKGREIVRRRRG